MKTLKQKECESEYWTETLLQIGPYVTGCVNMLKVCIYILFHCPQLVKKFHPAFNQYSISSKYKTLLSNEFIKIPKYMTLSYYALSVICPCPLCTLTKDCSGLIGLILISD